MLTLWGWKPLACRPSARWLAVRDARSGKRLRYRTAWNITNWTHNRVRYRPDVLDEWSPPADTLARGYGDCEDFALLKRSLFLEAGGREEDAIFLLVTDLIARRDHALLLLLEKGEWLVLDSYSRHLLPVDQTHDYAPRFAFQGDRGWTFGR